jgi:flagellar basal body-associated protein FliL
VAVFSRLKNRPLLLVILAVVVVLVLVMLATAVFSSGSTEIETGTTPITTHP